RSRGSVLCSILRSVFALEKHLAVQQQIVPTAAVQNIVSPAAIECVVLNRAGEAIVARLAEKGCAPGLAGRRIHHDSVIARSAEDADGFAVLVEGCEGLAVEFKDCLRAGSGDLAADAD